MIAFDAKYEAIALLERQRLANREWHRDLALGAEPRRLERGLKAEA